MAKMLERAIQEQTTECLGKQKMSYIRILEKTIERLTLYLTDEVSNGFDSSSITVAISIDIQKVFGTIQHNVLLQKVPALGFSN